VKVQQSTFVLETAEKLGYKPSEGLREKIDQEMLEDAAAVGMAAKRKIQKAHKQAVKAKKVIELPKD
jgi:hypothetical protein